jgi:serine/threonine-protein kinase
MSESAVTIPDHLVATTLAPTDLGELPPDLLSDASFSARYVAGEQLGEGGMGVVRACTDQRIGREVAMKIVRPGEGSGGDLKARFLREACVQGQLEHPAIVPVYDLGRDGQGTLYFTMKRVRGSTFEQIIDALHAGQGEVEAAKHYSRRKLLSAFASVCHAVAFAHARGVVHRDLKPGNVMLGDYGEVYVLDWGLAKVVGSPDARLSSNPPAIVSGSDPGTKTALGAAMGTPGYMAPEQVRGETVDARADVYALGAILFELLALQPLHPHGSAEAAKASTLRGVDARPSARAPELDLPPELDEICVHATANEPSERTPGVREMVEAIERYLDGDRDLERRRTLAREHVEGAARHAERALSGTGSEATRARSMALREVGRAIALDPTNEDAVRTLMRLMTEPPAEVPAEANRNILLEARRGMRQGARLAVYAYLTWFVYTPLMLWMGLRSWTWWGLSSVAWLAAATAAFVASRSPSSEARPHLGMTALGVLAIMTTTAGFGPYVILPTLAVIGAMLNQMPPNRLGRERIVALYCLAFAVPAVAQWAGLMPAQYLFEHGNLVIVPGMLSFRPVPTHVFFIASNIGLIVTASFILARFRDTLSDVERRLHVQTWQLRQLVPEEARPASAPPMHESVAQLPDAGPAST